MRLIVLVCLLSSGAMAAELRPPAWAEDAVWYQIYPERFRNGDSANDPTGEDVEAKGDWKISPWTSDWYQIQAWEQRREGNFYANVNFRRYGGDLQGIIDKLDYLSSLGITAIYLNPIFKAYSHHKYDASCLHHVDNNFGPDPKGDLELMRNEDFKAPSWKFSAADKLFVELIRQCHRRNIRVVIDGVFNHVGTRFPAFQDVVKHQQQSRYADWFKIVKWDDPRTPANEFEYKGWWNIKSLPEFGQDESGLVAGPREYVFKITRLWMDPNGDGDPKDGVDGWRLDVANQIAHPFWRQWRTLVKSINPDALIIGEIWENADEWLHGDEFDGVMNYRFAKAAVRFFIDTPPRQLSVSRFDDELAEIRRSTPVRFNYSMLNLLDSHDTDRIASMIKNPNREYDHKGSAANNPLYDVSKPTEHDRQTQKLMALFQMTYLGAPMIYYGTEAGMWGGDDPDDRKPMVWEDLKYEPEREHPLGRARSSDLVEFDSALFSWYQKLARLRNQEAALRRGDFRSVLTDNGKQIYAFERKLGEHSILVVLNNSEGGQVAALEATGTLRDLLTGKVLIPKAGRVDVSVPGKCGSILKPE